MSDFTVKVETGLYKPVELFNMFQKGSALVVESLAQSGHLGCHPIVDTRKLNLGEKTRKIRYEEFLDSVRVSVDWALHGEAAFKVTEYINGEVITHKVKFDIQDLEEYKSNQNTEIKFDPIVNHNGRLEIFKSLKNTADPDGIKQIVVHVENIENGYRTLETTFNEKRVQYRKSLDKGNYYNPKQVEGQFLKTLDSVLDKKVAVRVSVTDIYNNKTDKTFILNKGQLVQ